MSRYAGRRVFRPGRWVVALVGVSEALFVTGAAWTFAAGGATFTSLGLGFMSLVGLAGLADVLTRRVELADDKLHVKGLWGRRSFARREIAGVREAKGVAPLLLLADGRAVKLPSEVAGLGNPVRAWLKSG